MGIFFFLVFDYYGVAVGNNSADPRWILGRGLEWKMLIYSYGNNRLREQMFFAFSKANFCLFSELIRQHLDFYVEEFGLQYGNLL